MPAPVEFLYINERFYNEVVAGIQVNQYAPSYEKVGCFWNKNIDFNYANAEGRSEQDYDENASGFYNLNITDLDKDTMYYIKTYIISGQDTIYGNYSAHSDYFETGPYPAKLSYIYDVTSNGALVEGSFYNYPEIMGSAVEVGFIWGDNETIDLTNYLGKETNYSFPFEPVSYFIDSLIENTNYYAKSYIYCTGGTIIVMLGHLQPHNNMVQSLMHPQRI